MKYSKEEVVELFERFVMGMKRLPVATTYEEYKDSFLTEKGLLNTLEVGKWYKDAEGYVFFLKEYDPETGKCTVYGFDGCGEWINDDSGYIGVDIDSVPATDEEVKEALIKEAEKRGYEIGKKIKVAHCSAVEEIKELNYCFSENILSPDVNDNGAEIVLFKDGRWAKIIEEKEMTLEQVNKELGYKVKIVE